VRRESSSAGRDGSSANFPPEIDAKQARQFLQGLGTTYSCLALYLSSRVDILPADFCREFSLTADCGAPLSASELQQILGEEFSPGLREAFVQFNYAAAQSTLLAHTLPARLANGAPVTVSILRPEYCSLESDRLVPQSFHKRLVQEYCGGSVNDAVFLDFFSSLRRKCNFAKQLEAMELMSCDGSSCDAVLNRRIYRELSTKRVITLEELEGTRIDEYVQNHACNTDALSRRLCQAWLHQALRGNSFAVDLQPHQITVRENAFLFTGCDFVGLPVSAKENLWNYFMAIMVDDPDRAAMYLLREMWPTQDQKVDSETFRSKFRQSAYFGALEPLLGTNSNAIAQLIFQHWKTALEYGYEPKPHLLCFYRGLFSVARISHKLSPLGDPLREGIEEVRGDRILGQFKDLADWRYWFQNSDKFANALIALPKIMDDALTRASGPNKAEHTVAESAHRQARTGSSLIDISMICLVLALLILLLQSSNMSPMTEKAALLLLLLAGLLALRRFAG